MRVLRLQLRNWRGVADREVDFAPAGVTVVEGPNETGKSSLVEALDMLFDELDSSTKARVRAAKPVHADEGAEVEADVETGAYAFTYAKRFHRRAQTTLTVRAPQPESFTGREAHERVNAILAETLDVALWKALRVSQGMGLEQADLTGKPWLTAALDRAAGGAVTRGGREEALFDAVREEHDRWWSERGPRREVVEAEQRVVQCEAEVGRITGELAKLEQDVDRVATLANDVTRLEASCIELERRATERAAAVAALTRLRAARDDAEKRLAQAEAIRTRARVGREERTKLDNDFTAAESAALEAGRTLGAGSPDLNLARAELTEAEQTLACAEADADAARREAALRERDFEHRRDELDLVLLDERRARLEAVEREAAAAEETVASVRADDATLARLRALHEEVIKAQVRLEAASAAVRVEALGTCSLEIDGTPVHLAAGAARDVRVVGAWRIEVPSLLRVVVSSGAETDAPRAEFETRQRALQDALAAASVPTLDEAVTANAALREARRALADRDRVTKENLRDLKREELILKIERLRLRIAAYGAERAKEPALPADFEAAQEIRSRTKLTASVADAALTTARARRDSVKVRADALATKSRETEVRLRVLRERSTETRRFLDAARVATPDDAIDRALEQAEAATAGVTTEAQAARAALEAAQPDVMEELARSARTAADQTREQRHQRERELASLRATLALRGEEGLSEQLGAAESALDVARGDAIRKNTQAAAAKALFDLMAAERDADRARYVAPFRARVESLGKIVFGADFSVAVDDDLRIVNRTMAGRTVDYDSLSGGAREQIGVISRAACALLTADEGGVPVLLDDAFGWSDPDRLERMGALLAVVGRSCQVILLTCDPARHRRILGARVVRIG